jgi:lipopolysaccharide biosynthesis glycosyltransferase
MTDRGVIYYATGAKYVEQALISAKSLKAHNDVAVTVYTDRSDLASPYVDMAITISPGDYPFYDRINYFQESPYDRTVYLDTDTYIAGDITPLFAMLERFDIVAAFNEDRNTAGEHTSFETIEIDVPDAFPEYQCGVIGYRNTEAVQTCFDEWQQRYKPYRDANLLDQPHFREALYHSPVSIGTLPREYNVMVNFGGYLDDEAVILHYGGDNRPYIGDSMPGAAISEEIVRQLNENTPEHRVFFYDSSDEFRVVSGNVPPRLPRRTVRHLRREGLESTVKKAIQKLFPGD